MMGAVQPFISGAISKTANMPEAATIEDVTELYIDSWKLGVKALAIYRDNCKVAQPLGSPKEQAELACTMSRAAQAAADRAHEIGRKFQVGDYEGYIHVGLFPDGTPGDIFVDIAKEGTTLAGLMNSLMISVSLGLQYGVPPDVYVSKFIHMRFEPTGLTNDPDIRVAKSLVDYIFRWLGKKFLDARAAGGARHPVRRGEGLLADATRTAAGPGRDRGGAAGPDGALQLLGGRGRMRPLRRPHDPHRVRATRAATAATNPAAAEPPRLVEVTEGPERGLPRYVVSARSAK